MQTFEETVRKRSLVALATIIGLALLIACFGLIKTTVIW